MKKKRNVISTAILVVLLLVGLSVMLYPTVSDWWNSRVQTRAIATYNQSVEQMDTGDKERLLMEAHSYNATLSHLTAPFTNWEDAGNYDKILDISGTGIMGYISIPKIQVELPIYHGTSAEVLNVAVGHLQGSSFPVGGENTHAVISAHPGDCPPQSSSPIWTSWSRATRSPSPFWMRCSPTRWRKFSSSNPTSLTSSPSSPAGITSPS